jgi:serine/threonine protein kinase
LPGYDGWEPVGQAIGEGGQGIVYLARSPESVEARRLTADKIGTLLGTSALRADAALISELADRIVTMGSPDSPTSLSALKQFKIPDKNKDEESKAVGRLESEVRALKEINHPAVLKLKHANIGERFMVTEYHHRGTLKTNLHLYKGSALAALQAFWKLVDGVRAIHDAGFIHRDIKAENIFVATSGGLVLGDFGIVFIQDDQRLTSTFERVGSHWWMAPWAYKNERLALGEINPKLDVYPLGKVLWSMIAGRNGFSRENFKTDDNNLEKLFPGDPAMPFVNDFLARCVVENESLCELEHGLIVRNAVSDLIQTVTRRRGVRQDDANSWPCHVCGQGMCHPASPPAGSHLGTPVMMWAQFSNGTLTERQYYAVFVCDHCKHIELFGTQ